MPTVFLRLALSDQLSVFLVSLLFVSSWREISRTLAGLGAGVAAGGALLLLGAQRATA